MSDTEKKAKEAPAVTFAQVVRFFNTLMPDSKCSVCGTDSFTIHSVEAGDSADTVQGQLIVHKAIGEQPPKTIGLPIITVECNHCGYLRRHSADRIADWIKNNPEAEGEGDQE